MQIPAFWINYKDLAPFVDGAIERDPVTIWRPARLA
jgi:hypothetical protein